MSRAASALVASVFAVAVGLALEGRARAHAEAPEDPPPEVQATEAEAEVAERHGAGAISGFVLIRNSQQPDLGGAALADLWFTDGALRIGAATGIGFVAGEESDSRLFSPIGASLAVGSKPRPGGFSLRLRAGGWTGATNGGFAAGGWLAAGFHIEYALDSRLAIAAGMDAWFLFGHGDMTLFAPGVSLVWSSDTRE
jgi:hypothetical protein